MSTSLHLPARILKVYIKASSGFSHLFHPYGLNNTLLSQGYVLETAPGTGNTWKNMHSKDRGGEGASDCLGPAHGSTGGHVLVMTSSSSIMVAVGSVEDSIA